MSDDLLNQIPPEERKQRRKLGEALMRFTTKMAELIRDAAMEGRAQGLGPHDESPMDDVMRRHVVENFRVEVERAARKGIEVALAWHSLGTWTEEGKERIGCFSRALDCVESGRDAHLRGDSPQVRWSDTNMRAECLYEIGRVHAQEGDPEVARGFLLRALPLAQEAGQLRGPAGVTHEDTLEGKIAELLLKLPEEGEAP